MSLATLRLFKALPIKGYTKGFGATAADIKRANLRTIPKGFIFAPEVLEEYPVLDTLINDVDGAFGVDPEALNKSFHKSFAKVRDASLRTLVAEQAANYLSTYGAEARGTYDSGRVFIPNEYLDAPAIDGWEFSLVVIRGLTQDELKVALLDLLSTGVALSEQSVKDALEIASLVTLSLDEIETVKNREVKTGLYELYGLVPANPVEFLRYVQYRTTGDTLLIKSPGAIHRLKEGVGTHNASLLFNRYISEHGIDPLGSVFLRFKPLFLALREDKALRPTINKIRRAATRAHKPMPQDYLNSVTALAKKADRSYGSSGKIDLTRLSDELENSKVNIFRKVRLAHALRVRTTPGLDSIVYKVRNGKSYAAAYEAPSPSQVDNLTAAFNVVMSNIADTMAPAIAGRRIYIPDGVVYGLPSSEKQFTGDFPAGTYIQVPRGQALVAGVYWEDQNGQRIDLDLSFVNAGGKIGWDGSYRRGRAGSNVLFSGDNTAAPNGASEVIWVDPGAEGSWLVSLNYYNREAGVPVPYKIVVGTADAKDIGKHFVIDPNRLVASASAVINPDDPQQNLGLVVADSLNTHRFYLGQTNVGGGISARNNLNVERTRRFLQASMQSAPTLNDVLYFSGATLVDRPGQADEGFDLSPSAIDKTTLVSILAGKVLV